MTSYDVAAAAGVSQSAVSRAFEPGGAIAPDTREKVRAAAEALGWQPNSIARSLQRRRADFVGVITSDLSSRWRAQQMASLIPALEDAGFRPLIFQTRDEKDADTLVGQLMSYQGQAVIVGAGLMSSRLAQACLKRKLLVISLNRWVERAGVVSIACDHAAGARMALDHLVERGARRLLYIRGRRGTYATHEREAGFLAGARAHGLVVDTLDAGGFTREAGLAAGARIAAMRASDRPDGVFAANDELALGLIDHSYMTGAYAVPRDFLLVGFDNISDAGAAPYRLSTVAQPLAALTGATIGQLRRWTSLPANRPGAGDSLRIGPELIVRRSSDPASAWGLA